MPKTILVPLTGSDADPVALETAYLAGCAFDAHLQCLHVRSNVGLPIQSSIHGFPMTTIDERFYAALEEENEVKSKKANVAFAEFCRDRGVTVAETPSEAGVTASWRELKGDIEDTIIAEARVHDLVVIGRQPALSALSASSVGSVLVSCGRPILIAPAQAPETIGVTVAIAWKNTPEAARALTAAHALLDRASKIIVLAGKEDNLDSEANLASADHLAAQLRWSGVQVQTRWVVPEGRTLPEAILNRACTLGADLLVMGGYGHSRLRELVFGGFTRHVLEAGPLPVFLFH